jgi:hypothetical protein
MAVAFIAVAVASWGLGALLIDWRRWRTGYTTALAASVGAYLLDALGFWSYRADPLPGYWPNLLLNVSVYPVGAWVFNQRYPRGAGAQVAWAALGEAVLLGVEGWLHATGHMAYHRGWNPAWSAVANLLLLAGLRLHFLWAEGGQGGCRRDCGPPGGRRQGGLPEPLAAEGRSRRR